MLNIAYCCSVQFQFGLPVGAFAFGGPTARSDPCSFAVVRRPYGRWRRGFLLDTGTPQRETLMDEKSKRASIYLRCSAVDNAEAAISLEKQKNQHLEYAREAGYWVDPELVCLERGSGLGLDRPELQRLMQAARDGRVKVLVIRDYDRLSRVTSQLMKMLRELNRLGVVVCVVSLP